MLNGLEVLFATNDEVVRWYISYVVSITCWLRGQIFSNIQKNFLCEKGRPSSLLSVYLQAGSDSKYQEQEDGENIQTRQPSLSIYSPQYWKSIYFHFSETLGPSPPPSSTWTPVYSSDRQPRSSWLGLSCDFCQEERGELSVTIEVAAFKIR